MNSVRCRAGMLLLALALSASESLDADPAPPTGTIDLPRTGADRIRSCSCLTVEWSTREGHSVMTRIAFVYFLAVALAGCTEDDALVPDPSPINHQ